MKFTLDPKFFMSHLLLSNRDLVDEVASTVQWRDEEKLEAELKINGVEVPAEHLESFIGSLWDKALSQIRERYAADRLDGVIEERAAEILAEYADNAVNKLSDLIDKISDPDFIIKPYWERVK